MYSVLHGLFLLDLRITFCNNMWLPKEGLITETYGFTFIDKHVQPQPLFKKLFPLKDVLPKLAIFIAFYP